MGTCYRLSLMLVFAFLPLFIVPVQADSPPAFTSITLNPSPQYAGLSVNITVSITDDNGISSASWKGNTILTSPIPIPCNGKTCSHSTSLSTGSGSYVLTFTATDNASQTTTETRSLTINACSTDAHCGGDQFLGSPSCSNDRIVQERRTGTCQSNGGCSTSTWGAWIKEDCSASGKVCSTSSGTPACIVPATTTTTTTAPTTLPTCGNGKAIPSSGCSCGLNKYYSGYCCQGYWFSSPCPPCTDSDGGKDFFTKGSTSGLHFWMSEPVPDPPDFKFGYVTRTDFCRSVYSDGRDPNWVEEFHCFGSAGGVDYITGSSAYCPGGCKDGACIPGGTCPSEWSYACVYPSAITTTTTTIRNQTTTLPQCTIGLPVSSSGCTCSTTSYYSGYCCGTGSGYYSSSPCTSTNTTTTIAGLPQCSEGAIPSSGCVCQGNNYYSGNCCFSKLLNKLVWAGTTPCTQTCPSMGGVCCYGAAGDCVGTWNGRWAVDCQGYACCVGTCKNKPPWETTTTTTTAPALPQCSLNAHITSNCSCGGSQGYYDSYYGYCCGSGSGYYSYAPCAVNATTTTTQPECTKEKYWNCNTESSCSAAGVKWCGTSCSLTCACGPGPEMSYCYDEDSCHKAGALWCGTHCWNTCPNCVKDQASNCKSESQCKNVGAYWCTVYYVAFNLTNSECVKSQEQCSACSASKPWRCYTESECKNAGGKWCASTTVTLPAVGGYCQASDTTCPSNATTTATPGTPPTLCGNGKCENGEYPSSCFSDCGQYCTRYAEPLCVSGYLVKGAADSAGCPGQSACCGDKLCRGSEDSKNCLQDCGIEKPFCGDGKCNIGEDLPNCPSDCRAECPSAVLCADNSKKPCVKKDFGCFCDPCPISVELPTDCAQEINRETGAVNVVCTAKAICPPVQDTSPMKAICAAHGGTFALRKDHTGCEYPDCQFVKSPTGPFTTYHTCHTQDEMDAIKSKCTRLGLPLQIDVKDECKVATCGKPAEQLCDRISPDERQETEKKCKQQDLRVTKTYDENGCPALECREAFECPKELPEEAYKKCQGVGGEMVIKKDENGCVRFADCLRPGDERDARVEPIARVPESSELLEMAFKLEELRIRLDRLANQSARVAAYYQSARSPDTEKWKRVVDMFQSAVQEIDEIKNELRDKLDTATADDLLEVRRSVRYVSDVLLKDVTYVMLSKSDDVANINELKDCGTDEACFNRAFRRCQPALFLPEGSGGPRVELAGLENSTCIMKAFMEIESGPSSMICRIPNYAKGVRNPKKDVFPHCEGSLLEHLKKRD